MSREWERVYDQLLVARCQRRELAAWDELASRWNERLLYYLRRLIDDETEATCALQDVWLHVFRSIGNLRDGRRLAPWLYTIARRTAMTRYRRRYASRETPDSERIDQAADEGADDQLQLENVELVHFGLLQLDLPEREVLTLHFLEDLTTLEIAELLAVPQGTVKSRMFKARRQLRRILQREEHGQPRATRSP